MNNIVNIPNRGDKKRIVIVGGGFAGLEFAKRLNPKLFQIVLIDKVNYYQFQPLLYQVATAGLEPSAISYPHRKTFRKYPDFHFRTCEALSVDTEAKVLKTTIDDIRFDQTFVATGCDTNYFGDESLKENTFALKSVSEALLIRNRILASFEEALCAKCEEALLKRLTFVIVGGGATGIELAGALADMRNTILPKDYPELDFAKMEIHLIDASPRLLSGMSERASGYAAQILQKRNVIIYHNKAVQSCRDGVVEIDDGTKIPSNNVFWVAGVTGNSLHGLREEASTKDGRLLVDEYNRVKGYENIFCIGDTALMITEKYPYGHPLLAQPAIQMAKNLAKNINKKAKDGNAAFKPFRYKDRGSLATIGRNAAVADFGKLRFGGRIAWWLWLCVHILSIVGRKNKFAVFLDWVWSYFTYDASLRLLILPKFNEMYRGVLMNGRKN